MNLQQGLSLTRSQPSSVETSATGIHSPFQGVPDAIALAAMQQLIDDLPEQIAVLSEDSTIVAVNSAWTEGMALYGYAGTEPGGNYRGVCEQIAATGYQPAIEVLAGLDHLIRGTRNYWELLFNGRGEWSRCQYRMSFHRVNVGGRSFITITRLDLTESFELRRLRSQVRKSIVDAQSAERARLGRELHDSTSQHLVLLTLLTARLKRDLRGKRLLNLVGEIESVAREAQNEIRSIAYLTQRPVFEGGDLAASLKSLVERFGRRAAIQALFEIVGHVPVLPQSIEGALYRIVQEALANVQRHANATNVRVILRCRLSRISVFIMDDGSGISPERLRDANPEGLGVSSMRSRLAELGGSFHIRRVSPGTAIVASLPLASI